MAAADGVGSGVVYELTDKFVVRAKLPEVWGFFSSVENLAEITPKWMAFTVRTPEVVIEEGAVFDYTIRWGVGGVRVPVKWRTRIILWEPRRMFVDLQVRGPYVLWHHQHSFREVEDGVECGDRVSYILPAGPVGRVVHAAVVRRQLREIFEYRRKVIGERLGWVREIEPVRIEPVKMEPVS